MISWNSVAKSKWILEVALSLSFIIRFRNFSRRKKSEMQKIVNYPLSHSHEIGFSSQVPSGLSLIHIAPFKSSDGEFNISFFRMTHSLIELTTASDFVPGTSNITNDIDL